LRTRPHLDCRLKRCLHCGILFFTERSNINRDDLRCPFGCATWHRRVSCIRRCAEYYRTEKGRSRKKALNRRRCLFSTVASPATSPPPDKADAPAEVPALESSAAKGGERVPYPAEAPILFFDMPAPIIRHIRMVTSMIEGRAVSLEEIRLMLHKVLRQHGLTKRRRFHYFVEQLNKGPP